MVLKIPETLSNTLHEIGEIGGKHTYLVGGSVRDLLLKRNNLDIDIVVEGDAIEVARQLQNRWSGSIQTHPHFGTATATPTSPDKPKVDFVTARSETYQKPGTLPKVEHGTIIEDLLRRDFSINALAMCLDAQSFGAIIDKTGGLEDLKNGTIRVLHNQSYKDDPTRIFRAFRYSGRYKFQIADSDVTLIEEAIPLIAELSGERIRNEIDRVLVEDNAPQIVQALAKLGIYEVIYPGWKISPSFSDDFATVQQAISWASEHLVDVNFQPSLLRWMAFFGTRKTQGIPTYHIEALCFRLVLTHQLHRIANDTHTPHKEVSFEKAIRSIFDKLDLTLSDDTSYDYQNGKWSIVDSGNKATYVYSEGNIYKIQTPIAGYQKLLPILENLTDTTAPSIIYHKLKPFPIEALALGYMDAYLSDAHRKIIGVYLLTLRNIQPFITGSDLIQWGEKPGKSFDTVLSTLFSEQLDGNINSKSEGYSHFRLQKNQSK